MKKIVVLLESLFEKSELIYPYHRLREDFDVVLVGSEKYVEYPSKAGYKVKSDIISKEAYPSEFDGVYIPGAYSPDGMRKHEATINFVKKFHENGKSIAAVCHGPWVVSDAGLLDGVKASSTPTIKKDLINAGAKWEDREVVVYNNIITRRSPKDLPAHVKAFVDALK
ncbi:General stress protein 18 [Anaerococcus prevotii]|uniref:Intracellular protease, PfpI family n=1 Tax=Anaerococcus prevotii (strain ATCC 9321 / DSM 20548 / JCM 6508 / NCTC 11806 / PC1) TaxID=525919 RepID=C7RHW9_ANAPD|nr:type 1 glutamine amidotransferase domain-containing protein [Anaerococcus prevotii]ACV29080.1 intracellular protease, PfpI family [Anaerococcus prevotii DSM 20548]SUU94753.1 General stress protein 18 [Anaerococcus prevotii]